MTQVPGTSSSVVRRVCHRLEHAYGSPRLGNPVDPLDDLIFIVVSNRTGTAVATRVYSALRERFPDWCDLHTAPDADVLEVLGPAGLARRRMLHLRAIVRTVCRDFGRASLGSLAIRTDADIEAYLTSLPGVSTKVAKCVMLYAMDRQVLPVDVHVHRLAVRLGWIAHRRADQSHKSLEGIVPPDLRYGFHTNAIAHGRLLCRARPLCEQCFLLDTCPFGRRRVEMPDGPRLSVKNGGSISSSEP